MTYRNWFFLNMLVFTFFFLGITFDAFLPFFWFIHIGFGLAVFFLFGINLALIVVATRWFFKKVFSSWEILTIGIFLSIFLLPFLVYATYRVVGAIAEVWLQGGVLAVTFLLLISVRLLRHDEKIF